MGAYLSKPICDKVSEDYEGDRMRFGASAMQGWRMSQEDAHCCLVDFDAETNTSLFAVYDGHGGSEVAQYTAEHFPDYLKTVETYKEGQLASALEDAFLGFDATLVADDVKKLLKELASGTEPTQEAEGKDEDGKTETAMLCEEATMPIEQLLERYGGAGCVATRAIRDLKKAGEKFVSPVICPKPSASEQQEEELGEGAAAEQGTADKEISHVGENEDELRLKLADKLLNGLCDGTAIDETSSNGCNKKTETDADDGVTESDLSHEPASLSNGESVSQSAECSTSEVKPDPAVVQSSDDCTSTTDAVAATSSGTSWTEVDDMAACSSSSAGSSKEKPLMGVDKESSEEDSTEDEEDSEDEQWNSEEAEDDSEDDEDLEELCEGTMSEEKEGEEEDEEEEDEEEDAEEIEEGMNFGDDPGADSGCTAVVALIRDNELYVANAGDSRCVLCRAGKAVEMSVDHKPEDTVEQDRIVNAGGRVTCDGRVNGGLNLSRAIGDHTYKQNKSISDRDQMITALPDVRSVNLDELDQFMVLACDGIWNVMSSQDVVDFVQTRLQSGVTNLSVICEEMFDFCLAPDTTGDGTGCDNMTCMIVTFNGLSSAAATRTGSSKRKADSSCDDSVSTEISEKRSKTDDDGDEC